MKKEKKQSVNKKLVLDKTFADFLELFDLSLKSGMNAQKAFQYVATLSNSALSISFNKINDQVKLGIEFDQALINFANSQSIPAIYRLVSLMVTSSILGVSITENIERLIHEIHVDKSLLKRNESFPKLSLPCFESISNLAEVSVIDPIPLEFNKKFIDSSPALEFLKLAIDFKTNILFIGAEGAATKLLLKELNRELLDLEKLAIIPTLLSLSSGITGNAKIAWVQGFNTQRGLTRLRAMIAQQDKELSESGMKEVINLLPLSFSLVVNLSESDSPKGFSLTISSFHGSFLNDIFRTQMVGVNEKFELIGNVRATGSIPIIVEDMERAGVSISRSLFMK